MSNLLKMMLSMTIAGTGLIGLLFLLKPLYRNKLSMRWQYYTQFS